MDFVHSVFNANLIKPVDDARFEVNSFFFNLKEILSHLIIIKVEDLIDSN